MKYLSIFSAVVFYSLIVMGQACLDLTASINGISFKMWDSEKGVGIAYTGVVQYWDNLVTTTTDRDTVIEAKMITNGTDNYIVDTSNEVKYMHHLK